METLLELGKAAAALTAICGFIGLIYAKAIKPVTHGIRDLLTTVDRLQGDHHRLAGELSTHMQNEEAARLADQKDRHITQTRLGVIESEATDIKQRVMRIESAVGIND